jgi:hypothetical protein
MSHAAFTLSISLGLLCACAAALPEAPRAAETQRGQGLLCKALLDRFVGLPAQQQDPGLAANERGLIAGRWWVRSCSTKALPGEMEIRLGGPGWYWVDVDDGDIELHQQVPFQLEARLWTTFEAAYSEGVASLWLEPTREPAVELVASNDLDVHGASVWGWFMRYVPFFPIRGLVAKKLSETASTALRHSFGRGATLTYDILRGQSDVGLGKLGLGKTPERPFAGRATWIVNERLSLPSVAVQVIGPIDAAARHTLDFDVEQGAGVLYQAVCLRDVGAQLGAIVSGTPQGLAQGDVQTRATVEGLGLHTTELRMPGCRFCLVVSPARGVSSVIALRVRE